MSAIAAIVPANIYVPSLSSIPANPKTLLLEQCKSIRDLHQIHAHLIKTGSHLHPAAVEGLLESSALVLPNSLGYALKFFHHLPSPHTKAYNVMIMVFNLTRSPRESVLLYLRMLANSVLPDQFTFSCLLKSCSRLQSVVQGEQLHAHIAKCGFGSQDFVQTSLIHMYASCGDVGAARNLFDKMPEKGVVTWNAMVAGYFKAGDWEVVVELFHEMVESRVVFEEVTLISVLTACGQLGILELGECINRYIEDSRMKRSQYLLTSLIDMYAKCGQVGKARRLFDEIRSRDVVAWSAMISGYSQSNQRSLFFMRCKWQMWIPTK